MCTYTIYVWIIPIRTIKADYILSSNGNTLFMCTNGKHKELLASLPSNFSVIKK